MAESAQSQIPPESHADLAHAVMRRQAALSIRVAAIFLAMLFGLPLFNYLLPGFANLPIFGFTATWLFLGVMFYPITWVLSWYFIRESDRIESECSDWRAVLGIEAGEPLEPQGIGEIKPAFIETDEIPLQHPVATSFQNVSHKFEPSQPAELKPPTSSVSTPPDLPISSKADPQPIDAREIGDSDAEDAVIQNPKSIHTDARLGKIQNHEEEAHE
jgi:uncharacterized membrane protein (DUF485 family)